jgi:hypothetical protein
VGVVEGSVRRLLGGVAVALVMVCLLATPSAAQPSVTAITSNGPLTRIAVSTELNCQVAHQGDQSYEFYDGLSDVAACGTFLSLNGVLYGPSEIPAGFSPQAVWTGVSQSTVTGSGTDADPFTITTVADAGPSARVTEIDSYAAGKESYRTDIQIQNRGSAAINGFLYRAADCYLQDSDVGVGRIDDGAPACVASDQPGARIEQWVPLTSGSHAFAGQYFDNWNFIQAQQQYPDRCDCQEPVDDGAGISWTVSLEPDASATFSHLTLFSPAGRRALTTTLTVDDATPQSGAIVQFLANTENPDNTPLPLNGVHATLPPGFVYLSGSSTGAAIGDPTINGTHLSWNTPNSIPLNGGIQFGFSVGVAGNATTASVTAGVDPADPTRTAIDATSAITVSGGGVAQQPLRSSVPSPTQLNLSPQVVAQTVIITASVVVLIPFPSALFNATLEQNYDEIVRGVRRTRKRLAEPFRRRRIAGPNPGGGTGGGAEAAPVAATETSAFSDAAAVESSDPAAIGSSATVATGSSETTVEAAIEAAAADPPAVETVPSVQALSPASAAAAEIVPRVTFWATLPGVALFMVISALLYCLLDPTFGFNLHSLATFAGVLIGLALLLLAFGLAFDREMKKRTVDVLPRALPGTIAVGIACVLISRLASFQPGYLYGLVVGFLLSRELAKEEEGRGMAIATAWVLVATGLAWLLLIGFRALEPSFGDPPIYLAAGETACVTLTVAGIEMALFAMLPLRFLPGDAVLHWNKLAWGALVACGVFGFFLVLINPQNGYLGESSRSSLFTMVLLLGFFAVASVIFWAYFRFRPEKPGEEPPTEEALL